MENKISHQQSEIVIIIIIIIIKRIGWCLKILREIISNVKISILMKPICRA